MSTISRLDLLKASRATALFCTPTYAIRMAEVAEERGIRLAELDVRRIVVAGEPGGSLPAVRARISGAWDAQVIDHSGATEVGPWGAGDRQGRGLHVLESEFIAEFFSVETGRPAAEGELAHLVLTSLGRIGCPVIRYQTGDLVRPCWASEGPNRFVLLEGGVVGRADDMLIVRGVNIFPSAVEEILRGFPEVAEYRLIVSDDRAMDQLTVEVEDRLDRPGRIAETLMRQLGLKIVVRSVPPASLPRFEGKARRVVDGRASVPADPE